MRRNLFQRGQDVVFGRLRERLRRRAAPTPQFPTAEGSVSGVHDWVALAEAVRTGQWPATAIRRHPAVFDIVETVGPTDGQHYAAYLQEHGAEWLADPDFASIDRWGDPLRWPAQLLGTARAHSPTSLRYLATACALAAEGQLTPGQPIVEVGVGFGGLAARNHWISKATTTLVDLPSIEGLAAGMIRATRGVSFPCASQGASRPDDFCFISNYAFTELSTALQDAYFETWVRHSATGLILSNAAVFAERIGGRSDADLLRRLRDCGHHPVIREDHPLLSPTDLHFGVKWISW